MSKNPSTKDLLEQAKREYQSGDLQKAAEVFAEAAHEFTEAGDVLMAAEMKNNLSVTLLRNKQFQAAFDSVKGTDLIFASAGDLTRQGMALANQASALQALKRFKEAIEHYKNAGDIFEKAGEMELRIEVMQLLSALYLRTFKLFDAIIALQSGLANIPNPTIKQRLIKKLLFFRL